MQTEAATMQSLRLQYFIWAPRDWTISQCVQTGKVTVSTYCGNIVVELAVLTRQAFHIDVLRPQLCLYKCQLGHNFLSANPTKAPSLPKFAPEATPGPKHEVFLMVKLHCRPFDVLQKTNNNKKQNGVCGVFLHSEASSCRLSPGGQASNPNSRTTTK